MHSLSRALYLPHLRASTTIYSQVCELQGSPMISYFLGHSVALSPLWSPWSQQLGEHSSYAPTFCPHEATTSPTFCPMIPWSRKTMTATNPCSACPPGSPICQLLLRQLLSHSYALDNPSSKFQIVASRTHDLHKPLCAAEFASACRLLMSSLLNSSTAPVLVSLCPWRVFLPGLDISCRFSFDEPIAT